MSELTPIERLKARITMLERELDSAGGKAHRRRLNRLLAKERTALAAKEQAEAPAPAPEEYVTPIVRSVDDRMIRGLTGKGAILRLDTLAKLNETGKITPAQYSAGRDYLEIVEAYFNRASGLAKLSEEAGRIGGGGDPIHRYIKARAARRRPDGTTTGYIPTQRPRNPSAVRSHSDGWTPDKLEAMSEFSRMVRIVERLPRDPRTALYVLVIDPDRPDLPALSIGAACRRMIGNSGTAAYARLTRWLAQALDEIDGELMADQRKAA